MSVAASLRSSKTHRNENFPVASRLLEARHRHPILAFYDFARTSDDVADHPTLGPDEKLLILDQLEDTLLGRSDSEPEGVALRRALAERDLDPRHAQDLLAAFRQDAVKQRYERWEDLIDYCSKSASPVGRYVLDVYGEPRSAWPASDALCTALQIINHMQDCAEDHRALDRCYIPHELFAASGARIEELAAPKASPALRACLNDMCARVDQLLVASRGLSRQVGNARLALEISVIQRLAEGLLATLREHDPLADDVRLHMLASAKFAVLGILRGAADRLARHQARTTGQAIESSEEDETPAAAKASRSSFYTAMRILPADKRRAIFEVYAFCRAVDDVADEPCRRDQAAAGIERWRQDIDAIYAGAAPARLRDLAAAVQAFGLKRDDFIAVIDGMEMDLTGRMRAPDLDTLDLYCDRVASAVGRLCVRIFGMEEQPGIDLAHHLGRALQLTNILRDLDEDAELARLYLPREYLEAAGIHSDEPGTVLADPRLDAACLPLADRAQAHFVEADRISASAPRKCVRAPRIMSDAYKLILAELRRRGWRAPRAPVRLKRYDLARIVVRRLVS